MRPGTALDLGCGQGGDAIWLAAQGWTVTGADISQTALDVAARDAAEAGVERRVGAPRPRRVAARRPASTSSTTSFLHSPVELPAGARSCAPRPRSSRPAARCSSSATRPRRSTTTRTCRARSEVVAELALPDAEWELERSELRERQHAFRGEAPKTRIDTVVRFRRR